MKILFLAHRTPYPPNKGDKIRSYNILLHLAEMHEVSLVYWVDDPKDQAHAPLLERMCRGAVRSVVFNPLAAWLRGLSFLCCGKSFSQGYFFSPLFQKCVDDLCKQERYDLFYIFSSPMAQYVQPYSQVPTMMDFVDVDSEKWGEFAQFKPFPFSWLFRLEKNRLAQYEVGVSAWARWNLFVSEPEAQLFREIRGHGNIVAVPNGVDSDLLRLPVREAELRSTERGLSPQSPKPAKLIFAGTMNYFPNVDAVLYFVQEILPLIHSEFPRVTFDIVGRFPNRAVRRLHGKNGVRVMGEVRDIREHLIQADVSVAPLRISRGIQNKVLEAMAMGVPVVATPKALEGIKVEDKEEVLTGDSPSAFAAQVVRLLRDQQLRSRVAKKARSRVVQTYSWKKTNGQLDKLIFESLQGVDQGVAAGHVPGRMH